MKKINALLFLLFICALAPSSSAFAQGDRSWTIKLFSQYFPNAQQLSLNDGNLYPFGRFSPAVGLRLNRKRPVWIDLQVRRFAVRRDEVAAVRKIGTDIAFNVDISWEQARTEKLSLGAGGSLGYFFSEKYELGISQDQTIINERINQRTGIDLNLLLRGRYQFSDRWSLECKFAVLGVAPTKERESRQFPTFNAPINVEEAFSVDIYFLAQVNLGIVYRLW